MNNLFDYQQDLDALCYTPEQKKNLAARAAGAARQGTRRARPVRRTALIAAALAAVLVVGAGASGVLHSAVDSFSGILGSGAAQTEIIDKIGRPIGASTAGNSLTITASAIIGDRYNACIVYDIERTDGQNFDLEGNEYGYLPLSFQSQWTDLRGNQGGTHGGAYFTDSTPGDNVIQYVETVSADEPLKLSRAKATFQDLCLWDDAANRYLPLLEGKWTLNFDIAYEDASMTLGGGETFQQDGMTFTVDEITVSPVAVRVAYSVDSEVQWSDSTSGLQSEADSREVRRYFEHVELLLQKTDGTVIDLSQAGGGISPADGKTICSKGTVLDEIIPLEELESISVGGIVYPVHGD